MFFHTTFEVGIGLWPAFLEFWIVNFSVQMAYKIEEVKIENRDTVQMENVISVSHILKKIFYKHLGIEQCLAEIESVDKVLRSLEGHSFFHWKFDTKSNDVK